MLVWVDIESSGLDPREDSILELGIIITDDNLAELHRRSWVCRWLGERDRLHPVVRAMHEKSGLFDECGRWDCPTLFEVSRDAAAMLQEFFGPEEKPPLCGSSVHFDRGFLAAQAPEILKLFSYRNIDVSTLTELAQRWAFSVYESRPGGSLVKDELPHRALPDLEFSIALLKHYRYRFLDNLDVAASVP